MLRGVKLLLALSVDPDQEDADRLTAIQELCAAGPTAGNAIRMLMLLTGGDDLGTRYYVDISTLLTTMPRSDRLDAAGLHALIDNQYLPDSLRALAGGTLLDSGDPFAYTAAKSSMPIERLITSLGELLERRQLEAENMLRRLSTDAELSAGTRAQAREELELFGEI
ncbi:hypothetical protein [Dactylosporangium sp. CA-233914]|uniref:hypothetical protein n=1 Tax=Dactylosporangium sp. CA-233914 TaxID=3239934 RepID=UPI003D929950